MTNKQPLFAVDIGNTRTKISFWQLPRCEVKTTDGGNIDLAPDREYSDSSLDFEGTREWLRGIEEISEPCRWIVSSVNADKTKALQELVRLVRKRDAFIVLTHADVPVKIEYDYPERLGMDRAVAAYAGLKLVGHGVPFLTVDVGTAATIDYVDVGGVFRGGAILPGPRLTAEALNAKTFQLPMLDHPERFSFEPGRSFQEQTYPATETQGAIRLGVVYTLVGAICAFYWKMRRRILIEGGEPDKLTLVLSGGNAYFTRMSLLSCFDDLDAAFATPAPRPKILTEPRLVINGLFDIAMSRNFLEKY